MTFTDAHLSISLDGFVAGPDQSMENPIGVGGMDLHRWHLSSTDPVDQERTDHLLRERGAYVMGRHMFGPLPSYDAGWRGWWGEDPPYHAPVFVLTHHEHEPIEMEGGTTFHFVTGGFDEALRSAREAGDGDVAVAGGASTVRQALAAGELDELTLQLAPVLLGDGERLFDGSALPRLEQIESLPSSTVTHLRYRVLRA